MTCDKYLAQTFRNLRPASHMDIVSRWHLIQSIEISNVLYLTKNIQELQEFEFFSLVQHILP